jgi:bifunctional UDP-N-acetylglucosamine pyrophosphorylase/glucosamine-1-phosphate N-acetyltransferase
MRSPLPKVLQPLCGRPLLASVLEQALALEPERVQVVVGTGAAAVSDWIRSAYDGVGGPPIALTVQDRQLGTGHAVLCALPEIAVGTTVVLYGDMPLLRASTLRALVERRAERDAAAALLTVRARDPRGFGRIVRRGGPGDQGGPGGPLERIVEERDCSRAELELREVNVGVYAFADGVLAEFLPAIKADNAQGELYLTDLAGALVAAGREVVPVVMEDEQEAIGVNTLRHLAEARTAFQDRILEEHLAAGVYIEDPATTYIDWGVEIGPGTRIFPCTVIRAGVRIGAGCEVGPFTQLRAGTVLDDGAQVGNFTETKNARLGAGTKAKHLSYLGDVTIGTRTNIGAGTIVANYDGKAKHRTEIGDRAFVGSGSVLIAPIRIGDGALTGGGAVVTRNSTIPDGEAWVGVPARPLTKKRKRAESGEAS